MPDIRVVSRTPAIGEGKDHVDAGGVNLLLDRETNSPGKAVLAQTLPGKCAERPWLRPQQAEPPQAELHPGRRYQRDGEAGRGPPVRLVAQRRRKQGKPGIALVPPASTQAGFHEAGILSARNPKKSDFRQSSAGVISSRMESSGD